MSKSGYSDIELLEYIDKHFVKIQCELNGEEYKEPKHNHNLCIDYNVVKTIDYERSTLVCTKCGLCEYYPVYVVSYNHTMQPSRRKSIYKKSDNFKVMLVSSFMVERGLLQMTLWKQLGVKYTMELTYCIPMKYL